LEDTRHKVRNEGFEPHGYIIVPIKSGGMVLGVLYLCLPKGSSVDEEKRRLLTTAADRIGAAIENRRLQLDLGELALSDALTGLPNPRHLSIVSEKGFARARRLNSPLSVLLIDIDFFKDYNDRYGRPEGDRLLKRLAGILSKETREMDLVTRHGEDEFLILLSETELAQEYIVAERLRKSILTKAGITVSIGISSYDPGMNSVEELIGKAGAALGRAKELGRDRVEVSL
jgi:diguanylate cyclase (GGDEF)-like protein